VLNTDSRVRRIVARGRASYDVARTSAGAVLTVRYNAVTCAAVIPQCLSKVLSCCAMMASATICVLLDLLPNAVRCSDVAAARASTNRLLSLAVRTVCSNLMFCIIWFFSCSWKVVIMSAVCVASVANSGDTSASFQAWSLNLTRAETGTYAASSSILEMCLSLRNNLCLRARIFLLLSEIRVARPSWSDKVWLIMWFSATMIGDCTWNPWVCTDGSTRERVFLDGGLTVPAFAVGAVTDISMSVSPPP
jgi:hypothetical protein